MFQTLPETVSFIKDCLDKYYENNKTDILDFEDFLFTLLDSVSNRVKISYPRTVRMAKSVQELAEGDLEPSKVLTIDSPIMYKGHQMWMLTAEKELELHMGYLNGDKRFFSNFKIDAKILPHAILGGSTGSGKSVCLNAIIFSLLFLYPPWELNLYMSDSKIAEFARYGIEHTIPHIKVIAATSDSGFIISMLDSMYEEMNLLNNVISKKGVNNIADYREVTDLVIPRKLLIADEYQTTLKDAGNRKKFIIAKYDDFARLGRSTNYNMLLASQEVDDEVKPILTNIPIRMCLKSATKVSELILGNDQGALGDVGTGKIYVTDNPFSGDKSLNKKFRVPFQSKEEFIEQGLFLENLGKQFGLVSNVNFYDERSKLVDREFINLVKQRDVPNSIVLGTPSFISDKPDRFQVNFDDSDIENILVYSTTSQSCHRFFKSIYFNALDDLEKKTVSHAFLVADDGIKGSFDPPSDGFNSYYTIRDTNSPIWKQFSQQPYIRALLIEADSLAFSSPVFDDEVSKKFYSDVMENKFASEINYSRMYYLLSLMETDFYQVGFGINKITRVEDRNNLKAKIVKSCFLTIFNLGDEFLNSRVYKSDIPTKIVHVIGHNKINGLGRGSHNLSSIKSMLMDSYLGNVKFIFYSTNLDELYDINNGFAYYIVENGDSVYSKIKCEDPPVVRPVCAMFFSRLKGSDKVRVFKKLSLTSDKI